MIIEFLKKNEQIKELKSIIRGKDIEIEYYQEQINEMRTSFGNAIKEIEELIKMERGNSL